MNAKPWYLSKTFMLNAIALVIAVATMIADPSLAFNPEAVKIAVGIVTIGNMALRLVTSMPIEGTKAAREMPALPPMPGDQQ